MNEKELEEKGVLRREFRQMLFEAGPAGRRKLFRRGGHPRSSSQQFSTGSARDDRQPRAQMIRRTQRSEHRSVAVDQLTEDFGAGIVGIGRRPAEAAKGSAGDAEDPAGVEVDETAPSLRVPASTGSNQLFFGPHAEGYLPFFGDPARNRGFRRITGHAARGRSLCAGEWRRSARRSRLLVPPRFGPDRRLAGFGDDDAVGRDGGTRT